MPNINKVPASAGAQWLLDAFALLRKQPLALGLLSLAGLFLILMGLFLGILAIAASTAIPFPLSLLPFAIYFVLAIGTPCVVFAGVVWAVSEVAGGRPVGVSHLGTGLKHLRALLVVSLVPLVGNVLASFLMLTVVGIDGVQKFAEVWQQLQQLAASGVRPDAGEVQALIATLPTVRILLWILLSSAIASLVFCVMMLAVPQIVFSGNTGLAAIRTSLAVNFRNFSTMVVFLLLLLVTLLLVSVVAQIIGLVVQVLLGPTAAMLMVDLLMMAVLMPLLAGTAYFAWKQMLGGEGAASPSLPPTHIEV
jgi:hypothetical protein